MAKIAYTETTKQKGGAPVLDAVEAVYDGKTHRIDVYPGDTRTDAVKAAAIKLCLEGLIVDLAIKEGKPLPEKDGA